MQDAEDAGDAEDLVEAHGGICPEPVEGPVRQSALNPCHPVPGRAPKHAPGFGACMARPNRGISVLFLADS